jgi:hypothetical protein
VSRPTIPCPACWHETTVRSRLDGYEPCHADAHVMDWCSPYGGARGQQVTRWDGGAWSCRVCGLRLSPRDAGVLLDAALMCSDPDCDSIEDGMHEDARRALRGGRP